MGQEALLPEDALRPKQRLFLEMSRYLSTRHVEQTTLHLKKAATLLRKSMRMANTRQLRRASIDDNGAHVLLSCSATAWSTSFTDAMKRITDDIDRPGKLAQPTASTGPFQPQVLMLLPLLWFSSLPPHPPAFGPWPTCSFSFRSSSRL